MTSELRFNENAVCDICGRFGAYEFDGQRLCPDCYESRGSCCLEFGSDDLWKRTEAASRTEKAEKEEEERAKASPPTKAVGPDSKPPGGSKVDA